MSWSFPDTLGKGRVQLRRLFTDDALSLAELGNDQLFQYLSRKPTAWTEDALRDFIRDRLNTPDAFFYVILRDSQVVGMTSFLDVSEYNKRLEIGWTWLSESARGSGLNTEVKRLMLDWAFSLGAERVCLTTDARNARSQRAILKLGAKREGVLRKYGRMPDGWQRDVVVFSFTRQEWLSPRPAQPVHASDPRSSDAVSVSPSELAKMEFERFDYETTFNQNYAPAYELFSGHLASVVAGLPQPVRVLDVGCGNGWTARQIDMVASGAYFGIDTSANAIDAARRVAPTHRALRSEYLCSPASCLRQSDVLSSITRTLNGRPNMIICNTALHQIRKSDPDLQALIAVLFEVLDDGGVLLIGDYWYPTSLTDSEVEKSREWIRSQSGQTPTVREGFVSPSWSCGQLLNQKLEVAALTCTRANSQVLLEYYLLEGRKAQTGGVK